MGWVTRRQLVNLLGALTVTVVLAGLAFGLPAWDRSLPADRPVSAGAPYRITGTPGYQVTGGQFAVATGTGLRGLQGGYTAPGRGGRYAAYRAGPLTIEVTISGAELDLGRTLPAI